jgi:hypothetical protein
MIVIQATNMTFGSRKSFSLTSEKSSAARIKFRSYTGAGDHWSCRPSSMMPPGICAAEVSYGRASRMSAARVPCTERAPKAITLQLLAEAGSSKVRQPFFSPTPTVSARYLTSYRRHLVPGFCGGPSKPCDAICSVLTSGAVPCAGPLPSQFCWLLRLRKAEMRGRCWRPIDRQAVGGGLLIALSDGLGPRLLSRSEAQRACFLFGATTRRTALPPRYPRLRHTRHSPDSYASRSSLLIIGTSSRVTIGLMREKLPPITDNP